jgi:hypothetical protein
LEKTCLCPGVKAFWTGYTSRGTGNCSGDLEKLATTQNRSLGPELAAEYAWNKLDPDSILSGAGIKKDARDIAKAAIFLKTNKAC